MEPMKVSFSFNKLSKKTNIVSNSFKRDVKKVELIECLEEQSIKVKDAVEEIKQPLIIPLKDDQKNLLDRVRAAKKQDKQVEPKNDECEDIRPDSELTVDELVARQLLQEAKDRLANGYTANNSKISVLPINEQLPSLEGEKEPTLEDYEAVPISDYGLALLRGMGWEDGKAIGKNISSSAHISVPELRPKGLGLGATKAVQSEMPAKKAVDKDGNELILMKGAYAKVIAGPQKGNYCEVQGFDEEAGRVIIKVYPRAEIVNINELMLAPVTKEEFANGSKILNNAKYEEYKELSDKKLDKHRMKSEPSDSKRIKKDTTKSHSDSDDNNSKYREKLEPSDSKRIKKEIIKSHPDSDDNSSKYRVKSEPPDSKRIKKESTKCHSDSDDNNSSRHERNSRKLQKDELKSRNKSKSPPSEHERDRVIQKTSMHTERNKSLSKQRESRNSDTDYYGKDKNGKEKKSGSSSKRKSKSYNKKDNSASSSDDEEYSKDKIKGHKKKEESKYRSRSRSGSKSRHASKSKKDKVKQHSSDEDYYEKDKKSKKHSKSKNRDRSRSKSRDKHKKSKKHSSRRRDSSESDDKKEKRKKNKCKSRHRRNSSSSSEDKRYRSKK